MNIGTTKFLESVHLISARCIIVEGANVNSPSTGVMGNIAAP